MISFLMPAKNTSFYITDAIMPFINNYYKYNFELIIIDDFSTDDTFNIITNLTDKYDRLNVYKNILSGKNNALNFAFSLAKGNVIKCIDSDDVISDLLFKYLEENIDTILVHDSCLVDHNLKMITYNKLSKKYFKSSLNSVIKNCISPARWVWSFPYEIGNKIFPIPDELPFEDFWFSIVLSSQSNIKKVYIPESLYLYRQHDIQEYGGVLNFTNKNLIMRSKRLLIYYKFLLNNTLLFNINVKDISENIVLFNFISKNKLSIFSLLSLKINNKVKFKYLILLFFPKTSYYIFLFKLKYL
jgi:glycosyltransferase involved in cell wall biosynthesis